jgi:hypothetical protein
MNIFLNIVQQHQAHLPQRHPSASLFSLWYLCGQLQRSIFKIARTHSQTNRHAFQFPLGKLKAWLVRITVIKLHSDIMLAKLFVISAATLEIAFKLFFTS